MKNPFVGVYSLLRFNFYFSYDPVTLGFFWWALNWIRPRVLKDFLRVAAIWRTSSFLLSKSELYENLQLIVFSTVYMVLAFFA